MIRKNILVIDLDVILENSEEKVVTYPNKKLKELRNIDRRTSLPSRRVSRGFDTAASL